MKQLHKALALTTMLLATGIASPASGQTETYDPEVRLAELGIELPEPPSPVANYVNGVQTGNLIFLAGKGPLRPDGTEIHGKLGADLTIEEGYEQPASRPSTSSRYSKPCSVTSPGWSGS